MSQDNATPLGDKLRARREELGISLEQAQAETRIRARYLRALEAEDYASLPDPAVGRGFLRNYGSYLGLDVQDLSRLYAERAAPPEPVVVAPDEQNPFVGGLFQPVPLHEMPGARPRRLWLVPVLIVVTVAAAFLAWWGYRWYRPLLPWARTQLTALASTATEAAQAVASAASATSLATATAAPSQTATPAATALPLPTRTPTHTPLPSPTPSPPVYTGIFVELSFTDVTWIQVTVDGVRQEQATLPAGTYRSYYGEQRIELRIGNAGGVVVTLNGQRLGTLGATAEVVDLIFEKAGDQVGASTPTSEPTSTRTPRPSPTLTPTGEPVTPTPSESPAP